MPAEQEPQSRGCRRREIERYLKDYYGQQHVVWLGDGIEGDDTDGHIDDLARFVDERTIVIGIEDDPRDANYTVLRENRRLLDAPAIRTAVRLTSSRCRCRGRSGIKGSACRRRT